MDAAVGIFAKKGYRDTTLDEIAITSEFGKGTIYNYFKSKEDIYSAIIDDVSANLYDIIQQADSATKNSKDFFEMHAKLVFQYCVGKRNAFIIYVREIAHFTTDIFITEVSQDTWIHFPWDLELQFAQPIAKTPRGG